MSLSQKKFDPDRYMDEWDQETSYARGGGFDEFEPEVKSKSKKPCHKCGSRTYTRLRYDNKALGFRRYDAIGCSKCIK